MTGHPDTNPLDRTAFRIALVAIAAGIGLRLWAAGARGSLWLDEASLALNILGRSANALATPLDWGQAAPVGFLWAEKAVTALLDPTARALRLVPCLAGVLTLLWTWQAGRRMVGPLAAVLATVVVAFSLIALRYSAEVKPYATDAATAIALIGLAGWVGAGAGDVRRWAALGFAGTIAVTCSLPSVFVLAACGIALGADAWAHGPRVRRIAAAAAVAWVAMFGVLWIVAIGPASGGAYLREYWAPVMLDPRAGDFVARVVRALASAVGTPVSWTGSVALALACAALWLTGAVILARRAWRTGVLLVGPFVLAAIASMIGVYPLSDRLAFFIAPAALLVAAVPVAMSVAFVSGAVGRMLQGVGAPETVSAGRAPAAVVWATALALGAFVGGDAWRFVRAPGSLEPTQALFASVRDDAVRDSTPVYVFARAVPAWVFATTEWRAPDDVRLARYVALAGRTDAPAHENFARSRAVRPGEGDTLVVARGAVTELVGLAPGVRYRIAGPTSAPAPSEGWADAEARRIALAAATDGARHKRTGSAWVVASHFFEGTPRDELAPLVGALRAAGLTVAEERRTGRDALALRVEARPPAGG